MNSEQLDPRQQRARLYELMTEPVDPETFIYAVSVFDNVYTGRLPAAAFAQSSIGKDEASAIAHYARRDQRFNAGMEAVALELQSMAVVNPVAYLTRLAMLPDLYGPCAEIFKDFIETCGEEGALAVQPALLRGAAVANVVADADGSGFDIADVLVHANRFAGRVIPEIAIQ